MYWKVFAMYGFSLTTVNDRESQMTSTLWKQLCKRYGVKIKFSSAHHPETNGQTKSANKIMKNYLCAYMNYTQDDWVDNLSMAEFAVNNYINASIERMPFFADYSFHLQIGIELFDTYKGKWKAKFLAADKIIKRQAEMMIFLQDQLAWTQNKQAWFANWDCQLHLEYRISNKVYMDARHFASEKSKKLLDLKNARPWKISKIIDNKAYKLEIPQHIKDAVLIPIFHL